MRLPRWIPRDPLIHFLALGALLFGLHAAFGEADPRDADERTITVDRQALLTFMQYRSSAFEPEYFEAQLDALSRPQLEQLAQQFVEEEAMAREARALGLDSGDYVIRRRLVQKIEFLLDDAGTRVAVPDEAELRRYFEAHRDTYRTEPTYTFTHVFIDNERPRQGGNAAAAQGLLGRLRSAGAGFNDAPAYGDRFPYLQNYVGRDRRFIADQFGEDFAASLEQLEPGSAWQGPLRSQYGYHLVLLSERKAESSPRFEEVRAQVEADAVGEREERRRQDLIADLVGQYRVQYQDLPIGQPDRR